MRLSTFLTSPASTASADSSTCDCEAVIQQLPATHRLSSSNLLVQGNPCCRAVTHHAYTQQNPQHTAVVLPCLFLQVTAGSAMGIVSLGQDSLMSTTITGTAYAAGGYTGSSSSSSMGLGMQPQQQQQGEALPGTYNGMGMQKQQQQGAMGTGMNGGMMNGMGMGGAAMPGQQVMGTEQGQVPAKTTSGAAAVAAGVRLVAPSVLAGLVFAVMLVV